MFASYKEFVFGFSFTKKKKEKKIIESLNMKFVGSLNYLLFVSNFTSFPVSYLLVSTNSRNLHCNVYGQVGANAVVILNSRLRRLFILLLKLNLKERYLRKRVLFG